MNIDRAVLALAGSLSLLGVVLGATVNEAWLLLVAFVALNQIQASLTRWCPAASILGRLGVSAGCAFEPRPAPAVRSGQQTDT